MIAQLSVFVFLSVYVHHMPIKNYKTDVLKQAITKFFCKPLQLEISSHLGIKKLKFVNYPFLLMPNNEELLVKLTAADAFTQSDTDM